MAASIIRNLVRSKNLCATKLIARPPLPPPNLLVHTILTDEIPFYGHRKIEDLKMNPSVSSYSYPSFSLESFLHPVSSRIGLIESEIGEETVSEVRNTIWADSVKKKRKRKMNKHKLRKLRKSLKNKT